MKISILSAVYNEEAYIGEMIQSVYDQTHTDWELVFVSDGSTDRTVNIIQEQSAKDCRIRLAGTGRKIGKSAAFNRAYASSTGDIVVLLAGDDTLPADSLRTRAARLRPFDSSSEGVVAYFKLRTMSDSAAHDRLVLPKGRSASHSGGTITLTRSLADEVFPIDESLVSEDLWLCYAAEGIAEMVLESTDVVLHYRIHENNSNPRQRSFAEMTASMSKRHAAWKLLLDCDRFTLKPETRSRLGLLAKAEQYRSKGSILWLVIDRNIPISDRLAYASISSPSLFWMKKKMFRALSGRRSR